LFFNEFFDGFKPAGNDIAYAVAAYFRVKNIEIKPFSPIADGEGNIGDAVKFPVTLDIADKFALNIDFP
jgi:hypothetical protein